MTNKLREALHPICATEELKRNTTAFIRHELAQRRDKRRWPRYVMACCTLLLLSLGGFSGYRVYATPVSFISLDVNPSVELALNRFDWVLSALAYNDDGAQLLKNLPLRHKPYTEAVELLLADDQLAAYLTEDALLSFTVVSAREADLLAGIQQCHGYAEVNTEYHSADVALLDMANNSGLSMGKYRAFLELSQYDDSIRPEDCHGLSMRQIRDWIEDCEDGTNTEAPSQDAGHHGRGGGQGRHHGD